MSSNSSSIYSEELNLQGIGSRILFTISKLLHMV
nr:MAG TPA: hypothetical protein [Caudoviricetes sp.]